MAKKDVKSSYRTPKEFLKQLDDAFLECRRFGHDWRGTTVDKQKNVLEQGLQCKRCDSSKIEVLDARTGVLIDVVEQRRPPGYIAKGVGSVHDRAGRGLVRLEMLRRMSQ